MGSTVSFGDLNFGSQIGFNYGSINLNLDEKLPIVDEAAFDSFKDQHEDKCLPGTRTDIIRQITDWAFNPRGRCIFWLNGMAGTGKSTISRTIATSFNKTKTLGASFFFRRGERDRGNALKFFPTIARQLAIRIRQLLPCVQQAVQDDPSIATKGMKEQFDKLLLQPLLSIKPSDLPIHTVVIVIDALDECEGDNDIRLILQLLPQLQTLHSIRVRVFLTSRPELPIRLGFSKIATRDYKDLVLHEIPEEVIRHDISLFFKHRLSKIRAELPLPHDWPGETNFEKLVTMAVPLFIFAATICRVLEDPYWDPIDSLAEILAHQDNISNMDRTYLPVLDRLLSTQNVRQKKQLVQDFQQVVGSIVLLESLLSVVSLSKLLSLPERFIQRRLNPLHSVLNVPANSPLPVRLFHLSFRDFLLDPETRDKTPFWVDGKAMHYKLTIQCLLTCQNLRKNICGLASDGTRRAEVSRQTIDDCLPPELQYSCRYWVRHLTQCTDLNIVMRDALLFPQKHFLHWVEAMSLLGLVSGVAGMLDVLQTVMPSDHHPAISDFLHDAKRFVLKNRQIADEAPLQIYCAGLIFAPQSSIIRTKFEAEIPTWICQLPRVMEKWSAELQALEGHSGSVLSVAFSPDGRLLASGSDDKTVRLWDTATSLLQQILESQSSSVSSVAFSPDGRLLASGSDKTIRLWDTATGALQKTLEGHLSFVLLVTFSPDGRLLASGSDDETVRLWDTATGTLQRTLQGHSGFVHSVAFSPDGRLLASGSDKTIRLWDTATGTLQQTLQGHSGFVHSVAFSPDDRLLASGSSDKTIRLWDTAAGTLQQTLESHSSWVRSVAFSPDSRLLVSSSNDETVCLWDTVTGTLQQTLQGHSGFVHSVAFSPDGRLLASGSSDKTIRLWDTAICALQQTLEDHSSSVSSMAFSPDGRLLASGSYKTVRLWDTATGALQQTLDGHWSSVRSMAFSPDGRLLASGSNYDTVRLWDTSTGALQQTLDGHWSVVRSVAFSPDGRLLASGSDDETVRLWDTATGALQQTLEGHSSSVRSVAFSPDGRLLASGSDKTMRFWDTVTGVLQKILNVNGLIDSLEFAQGGSCLITNLGAFNVPSWSEHHAPGLSHRHLDVFIEQGQWIKLKGKNILWLPPESRFTCSAIVGNLLALGHASGWVSFIGFRV